MGKSGTEQPPLINYGFQNERSDLRIHVAPRSRLVFVFPTAAARELDLQKYRKTWARQDGVGYKTAEGYLVPPHDIRDLHTVKLFEKHWWDGFDEPWHLLSTTEKGNLAVELTIRLLKEARIPLSAHNSVKCARLDVQREGIDILLTGEWKIQVKHDKKAGKSQFGGTGFLFLQVAELNPLKRY
jgi:hypothetical protein